MYNNYQQSNQQQYQSTQPNGFFDELGSLFAREEAQQSIEEAPIPDGEYVCVINRASFKPETNNGYDVVKPAVAHFNLTITVGQFAGRSIDKFSTLRRDQSGAISQGSAKYFFQDLTTLGIPLNPYELENTVPTVKGMQIIAYIKTNGNFQNIYFKRLKNQSQQPQQQPTPQQYAQQLNQQYQQQPTPQQYAQQLNQQYQQQPTPQQYAQQPTPQQYAQQPNQQYQQQPIPQQQQNRAACVPDFGGYNDSDVPF